MLNSAASPETSVQWGAEGPPAGPQGQWEPSSLVRGRGVTAPSAWVPSAKPRVGLVLLLPSQPNCGCVPALLRCPALLEGVCPSLKLNSACICTVTWRLGSEPPSAFFSLN